MKFTIILFLVFTLFSCNESNSKNNTSTKNHIQEENFDWLLGDWKRSNDKEGNATYELWKKKSDKEYIGLGFTLQNQDTIFKENIRLIPIDGVWNFEVTGVNETPTLFEVTQQTKNSLICENEKNEFPKKIKYQLAGKKLQAQISGGGPNITFSFDKILTSFDHTKIAYTDEGEGAPIILIHGFISSGNSWNKSALKKDLLAKGFRVIVPDLRGNGGSDKPTVSSAYANDAEIKDLQALADHLKLDQYIAIGYSRGSIILAKLLTKDLRIQKAVIGGMGLDFSNPKWDRRIMFADAFSGRTPLNSETEGAVNYAKSIGANLKILGMLQDHQPVTSIEELQRIKTKILVIAGDQDKDNGNPADLDTQLPNSQLQIISGDHNNTYKAANFSEAVIKFITDH